MTKKIAFRFISLLLKFQIVNDIIIGSLLQNAEDKMIDATKFENALKEYKKAFNINHWNAEKYKWVAIKNFQDNWNINAENFLSMFNKATEKANNLLSSMNYFPRGMLQEFIKLEPEAVRSAFINLYDETQTLEERLTNFADTCEKIRKKHNKGFWNNHYQTHNAITTYLWLKYPDKYYIYKYSLFKKTATTLGSDYSPKRGQRIQNITEGFALYNDIRERLSDDIEMNEIIRSFLSSDCYDDPKYVTLTIDFGYFLGTKYNIAPEKQQTPLDHAQLNSTIWRGLLCNSEFTNSVVKKYLKYWYDQPSHTASCKEISDKYGENPAVYNATLTQYAKKVLDKFNLVITGDDGEPVYWRAIMTGDNTKYNGQNVFEWTLRPEITQAISELIEENKFEETSQSSKVNYWWLNSSPNVWSFSSLDVGKEQFYTLYNENGNKRRIFQNFLDLRNGDIIIGYESTPVKKIVGLAKVTHENDGIQIGFKKTEALASPIDFAIIKALPELANMEFFTNPNGSLFKLTPEEYACLIDIIREQNPLAKPITVDKYSEKNFLDDVYLSEQEYTTLKDLILSKQNVILQGAPGVGKTFTAKRLAYSIMGEKDDERITMVQFHQSYSYEDFVIGYRPESNGFILKEGIFYRFCRKAASQPNKSFFFIIDEINRGNLSKIFGELLMLIEKDYRDKSIELSYGGIKFSVPANIYIIGMMNTADRSLALMDYALRRRFSFFDMSPAFDSDGFKKYQKTIDNHIFDNLIDIIKELNAEIGKDASLGRGFRIGHSYFCSQTIYSEDWLKRVINYDIIPMLNEYWFDDETKCQKWVNKLIGVFND